MFPQTNDIYTSFFSFSPPTLNYGSLHDIFSFSTSAAAASNPPEQSQLLPTVATAVPEKTTSKADPRPPTSRTRPLRKDRHRKIYTAKGPRDRRMRLSLDVARKFFDLQDLLAFDKASNTVQWLLNNSKAAIKEHMAASKGKASTSECEERSSAVRENKRKSPAEARKASKRAVAAGNLRSRTTATLRVARECRDKARARARERTLEKKKKKMMMQCDKEVEGSEETNEPHQLTMESSLEILAEMKENCFITSQRNHEEPNVDESIAICDYNDNVETFFQDPMEMIFTENIDEIALLGESLL